MNDSPFVSDQQRKKNISRGKKTLFASLTAAMALLASLVLGETIARFFYRGSTIPRPPPAQDIPPYQANPYIVTMRPYLYFHIPGSQYFQKIGTRRNDYRINPMGFRGPEIPPQPAPGTKRLLVLGDSIVEGHGVRFEETFSHHLGTRLADQHWEVINLGVQGASPLYYAANMERYLYLHPDAVLILLHENDLRDDQSRGRSYFSSPVLGDRAGLYSGGKVHSPGAVSNLYCLLANTWKTVFRTPLEKIIAGNNSTPEIAQRGKATRRTSSFFIPPEQFDQRWAMSSAYLTFLLDALREKDINVLFSSLCTVTLAFPSAQQYASYSAHFEGHARDWALEHNVPFLSLVPTMKEALASHAGSEVLIRNDFHPTAMTHQLLADRLYPFVVSQLAPAKTVPGRSAERETN